MNIQFEFVAVETLPPLAWCARLKRGDRTATVFHGRSVETTPGFFAEAAWNDDFTAAGLLAATVLCGTGGACGARGFVFRASTDGQSPLFSVRKGNVVHVSNSPVFALAASGERPDPLHPFYSYDLLRIFRRGVHGSRETLRTASPEAVLGVHFFVTVGIDRDLAMQFEGPPAGVEPVDWSHYERVLEEAVRVVVANAAAPGRRLTYRPVARVSRGYDSTASAALAASAGCREAITLRDSRAEDPDRDNGARIAAALGMTCRSIDRWEYLLRDDGADAETGLTTEAATPAWTALQDDLTGRLVVVGTHGDCTWTMDRRSTPSFDLERPRTRGISGFGGLEFRLRTGFLQLAPPTIGWRHGARIVAIGRSAELRSWSIGGPYDRPLPRRIAEDRGVPRNLFGMVKIAGGHAHLYRDRDFSPAGLREYDAFRVRSQASASCLARTGARVTCALEEAAWLCLHGGRRRSAIAMRLPWQPGVLTGGRRQIPWRFRFVFQWACDTLAHRYRLPEPGSAAG